MRKAAKILFIIGLVIGLIWATVGFFGTWFGGAVVSTVEEMSQDSISAEATANTSVNIMLRLMGSFVVVIIGGVLGIVGAGKGSQKLKLIVIGFLTIVSGFILFPLSNYITAVIYIVAGLLLFLAGLTMKQQVERKKLMIALISMGLVLVATVGIYYMIEGNSEKQEIVVTDNVVDEQDEINEQNEQSATNETKINESDNKDSIEDFNLFFTKFKADSVFQKNRIVFPLIYETFVPSEDAQEIKTEKVKENEWKYISFYWDPSYAKRGQDAYNQVILIKTDTTTINYNGVDNGISVQMIFICKNNKWFYSKMIDRSN